MKTKNIITFALCVIIVQNVQACFWPCAALLSLARARNTASVSPVHGVEVAPLDEDAAFAHGEGAPAVVVPEAEESVHSYRSDADLQAAGYDADHEDEGDGDENLSQGHRYSRESVFPSSDLSTQHAVLDVTAPDPESTRENAASSARSQRTSRTE